MEVRPHAHDWLVTLLAALTIAGTGVIPLAVMPDLLDRFHVVKESVMRAQAVVGALVLVVAFACGWRERFRELARERMLLFAVAASVLWTGVAALLSIRPQLSYDSFVSVLASAILFIVVWYAAPRVTLLVLDVLVVAVFANAVLAAVQEYALYDPFQHGDPLLAQHLKATGLIGNPNVVGSWMSIAAVIFAVSATQISGWRRVLYAAGGMVAGASVLVSLTRTALIAVAAGLLLHALRSSLRRSLIAIAAVAILFASGLAFRIPLVVRTVELYRQAELVGWEVASSGRVAPALAAWEMFRDDPATGLGPGTYHWAYTEYKTRVAERHGHAIRGTTPTSFGDAHNDHLQMLAEVGAPGYLLFLAAIVILCITVMRRSGDGPRVRIARAMVVPLAGAFLVLALAQFPLHLAVTRHLLVTAAGLAVGWSGRWQ